MVVTIGGIVVALCGVVLLLVSPIMGAFFIALGVVIVVWGKKQKAQQEAKRQEQAAAEAQRKIAEASMPAPAPVVIPERSSENVAKTFTFRLTGVVFKCKYKKGTDRQEIIDLTEIGEPLEMKQYEWEGEPALALINPREEADIGVVPARMVNRVLKLQEEYDLDIYVEEKTDFEYNDEDYTGCDIRIDCLKR